ncbi:hypothetical protein BG006_005797 [Podila minutissima]|uniref:Xylanolytic transcriptional activator regulatory domain-containing protein n=1 Tax=Podila minutissima TaxID=64525 RepID=A0A9P5SUM4_9FUNG|nr:hypothetical protein BG006_005797 [Podila minutissima]
MESLLGGLVQGDRAKVDLDNWRDDHDDDVDSVDSAWPVSPDVTFQRRAFSELNGDSPVKDVSRQSTIHSTSELDDLEEDLQLHDSEEEELPFDRHAREKINSLSESLDNMTLDDGGFIRYLGNSSGIDLLQRNQMLKNGYLMVPLRLREHREWMFQKEAAIARLEMEMPLPPRDLAEHLIDCYFSYVHPNLPIIHKPTFMRQYRNSDPSKRPPAVLLHAMFAIASRFSTNPEITGRDPEAFGDEYFDRAKRLVDLEYELPRQSSIQALLLMVNYRFTSAKSGGRVWVMLGMAIRMAQDLGMHRSSSRWHLPPLETEIRKRLWWACYVMDRWASACLGRPVGIDDNDCDVDYPCSMEQDWADADGNPVSPGQDVEQVKQKATLALTYFVETIKLAEILGQILQRVYSAKTRGHDRTMVRSTIVELDNNLTRWLLSLPSELKYDHKVDVKNLDRSVANIHLSYYSVLILLHRPHMTPTALTKSKLSESMPSLNICVSAANSITHLGERLAQDDCLRFAWSFTTYEVFTASLIHLTNSASLDIRLQTQARNNLIRTIGFMKKLGQRWFNASKFSLILEDLMYIHLNYTSKTEDGQVREPVVIARVGEADPSYPIILRDQHHPSGGTLLFSPKVPGGSITPSSSSSTPASSPSTSAISNPDLAEVKQEPVTEYESVMLDRIGIYSEPSPKANPSHSDTNGPSPTPRSKKSRKSASQRNSLLFHPQNSGQSNSEQPSFTFASLSTPGMFTQGQAFMDYSQMVAQNDQQQPQQQLQSSTQTAQPLTLTPLGSTQAPCLNAGTQMCNGDQSQQISNSFGNMGMTTSNASMTPTQEDYSSLSLFTTQEMVQDPNLIAVPNPFFGIPNTIDWDEWNQYIQGAGLQKF